METMKHTMDVLRRWLLPGLLVAAVCPACFKTDLLVSACNGGALDTSSGDPFHDPNELARELVATRMRQELADGYFEQGPAKSQDVAKWMENLSKESFMLTSYVVDFNCLNDVRVGN